MILNALTGNLSHMDTLVFTQSSCRNFCNKAISSEWVANFYANIFNNRKNKQKTKSDFLKACTFYPMRKSETFLSVQGECKRPGDALKITCILYLWDYFFPTCKTCSRRLMYPVVHSEPYCRALLLSSSLTSGWYAACCKGKKTIQENRRFRIGHWNCSHRKGNI